MLPKLIGIAVIVLQFVVFLAVIGILIYLIFKRIEDKKKENFEDRDW